MIKEPVYGYREYLVSSEVEYIPCLPCKEGFSPITRIQSGKNIVFLAKVDDSLYKVQYIDRLNHSYIGLIMDNTFDFLLPIRRR